MKHIKLFEQFVNESNNDSVPLVLTSDQDFEEVKRFLSTDKKAKDLKPHEKFVVQLTGEYGSKDYFTLADIREYNPDDNLVSSDAVLSDDGADF